MNFHLDCKDFGITQCRKIDFLRGDADPFSFLKKSEMISARRALHSAVENAASTLRQLGSADYVELQQFMAIDTSAPATSARSYAIVHKFLAAQKKMSVPQKPTAVYSAISSIISELFWLAAERSIALDKIMKLGANPPAPGASI